MLSKSKKKELTLMANAIRSLTIDSVEKANSGHPGMPLGIADVATVLFNFFLKFDPEYPKWPDRDRFILSAGHGSMLLYAVSYLVGYKDSTLNQLKKFRQLGSKTAGHPEYGLLRCIETTTGPLGQGLANAVGMALSESLLNSIYGKSIVNHKTYVIVGDGCLMEGISQESISIAGHLKLKNLIVIFDNNGVSIDGPTSLTSSENHILRFKSCGWDTIEIDGHNFDEIFKAFEKAKKNIKPTFISCKTTIGFGSPNKSGKSSSHGSPLGLDEANATRNNLNILEWKNFKLPEKVLHLWGKCSKKGNRERINWYNRLSKNPKKETFLKQLKPFRYFRNKISTNYLKKILEEKKPEATRKSSQNSIAILSQSIKNFLGGSADLTESNLTKVKTSKVSGKKINYIHYGIREHLMAAAMNGISLHGGFIPYGGTFLIFSDYCKNAIRLSALMKQQVIYVFTHDSIGLGEDGPTHQPVEQLVGLRAIPNLLVLRPCDSIETFECWELALINNDKPSCLILSRQGLPLIRNDFKTNKCQKGAYFIKENKNSKITLFASGSELSLALKIYQLLKKKKINSNLVSIPSIELFESQSQFYKNKILGKNPRVFIEASTSMNWYKFKEKNDIIIGIDTFGESGKGNDVLRHFGFDENLILNKILKKI